jgi:hypothetical protein
MKIIETLAPEFTEDILIRSLRHPVTDDLILEAGEYISPEIMLIEIESRQVLNL